MAITKIQAGALPADVITTAAIDDASITHAKLHTTMDLSSKTVTLPTLSTLNTSGNVGIGTSSPATQASVQNSSTSLGLEIDTTSGFASGPTLRGYYRAGNSYKPIAMTGSTVHFGINDVEKMRIDSSGRVMIGTTTEGLSDGDNLTVSGSGSVGITIRSTSSEQNNLYFSDATSGAGEYVGYVTYEHNVNAMRLGTSGTERLRIDSSGRVGIGTSSLGGGRGLTVANGAVAVTGQNTSHSASSMVLGQDSTAISQIRFYGADNSTAGILTFDGSSANGSAGGERMRIDSSGNVLVGKTSAGYNVDGFEAHPNGETYVSRSGTPMAINRNSSDGTLLNFYKDGSGVGDIGSDNGRLYIQSSGGGNLAGIGFSRTAVAVEPRKNNAFSSSEVDVGSPTYKFRDAYLSGGVYLGGAGSANKLDDYEEGTFNFTMEGYYGNPTTTQLIPANYVKIGNTVHFIAYKTGVNNTGAGGNMWFRGLPFTTIGRYPIGGIQLVNIGTYPSNTAPFTHISGIIVYAMRHISNGSPEAIFHNTSTNGQVYLSGTYQTNA